MAKGENAGNQRFLLFKQHFLLYQTENIVTLATCNSSSANAFNLVMSKNLLFGTGLSHIYFVACKFFQFGQACDVVIGYLLFCEQFWFRKEQIVKFSKLCNLFINSFATCFLVLFCTKKVLTRQYLLPVTNEWIKQGAHLFSVSQF